MWKKVKNLDLFILVIDTLHNKYVCFHRQYHRDYNSFALTFSFEDWSNFHSDGKTTYRDNRRIHKFERPIPCEVSRRRLRQVMRKD